MLRVPVFLGYAFSPVSRVYTKAGIEAAVETSCQTATGSIADAGQRVHLFLDSQFDGYGASLNMQIHGKIASAGLVVLEVTETNPNVYYEFGVAVALAKPVILLQSAAVEPRLPADVAGRLLLRYHSIDEICGRLAQAMVDLMPEVVAQIAEAGARCSCVWGFGIDHPAAVNIVAPDTRRRVDLPDEMSLDYSVMEFVGDKDAVLEVTAFLARLHPRSVLAQYPSSQFLRLAQAMRMPTVVLGGPVGDAEFGGNRYQRHLLEHWRIPICYTEECDAVRVAGHEYHVELDRSGRIAKDIGIVMRVPNPFDPKQRVLSFHGCHTYGVLGIVTSFTDPTLGPYNDSVVRLVCGEDPMFYAVAEIPVAGAGSIKAEMQAGQITQIEMASRR